MNDTKQTTPKQPTDLYLVHLESGSVSVDATSLTEAIKLAETQLDNESKEI